jgi:hypothetical protein
MPKAARPTTSNSTSAPGNPSAASTSRTSRPNPKRQNPNYIPRPENAFMLFRKATVASLRDQALQEQQAAAASGKKVKHQRQADMSKVISQMWKSLSEDERATWDEKAATIRRDHEARYPDYRYHPTSKPRGAQSPTPVRSPPPPRANVRKPREERASPQAPLSPLPTNELTPQPTLERENTPPHNFQTLHPTTVCKAPALRKDSTLISESSFIKLYVPQRDSQLMPAVPLDQRASGSSTVCSRSFFTRVPPLNAS